MLQILAIIVGFTVTFVVLGGLSVGYSLPGAVMLAVTGAAIGALAAPEIVPKQFRRPAMWQVGSGVVASIPVAVVLAPTLEGFALAALIGGLVGYVVPYWIHRITLP